MSVYFIRL